MPVSKKRVAKPRSPDPDPIYIADYGPAHQGPGGRAEPNSGAKHSAVDTSATDAGENGERPEGEHEYDREGEAELEHVNLSKVPVIVLALIIGTSFGISAFFVFTTSPLTPTYEIARVDTNYDQIHLNDTFNDTLSVTVYDRNNATVRGAYVELDVFGETYTAQTGAGGTAQFKPIIGLQNLPQEGYGTITIRAEKEGYQPKTITLPVMHASVTR